MLFLTLQNNGQKHIEQTVDKEANGCGDQLLLRGCDLIVCFS